MHVGRIGQWGHCSSDCSAQEGPCGYNLFYDDNEDNSTSYSDDDEDIHTNIIVEHKVFNPEEDGQVYCTERFDCPGKLQASKSDYANDCLTSDESCMVNCTNSRYRNYVAQVCYLQSIDCRYNDRFVQTPIQECITLDNGEVKCSTAFVGGEPASATAIAASSLEEQRTGRQCDSGFCRKGSQCCQLVIKRNNRIRCPRSC